MSTRSIRSALHKAAPRSVTRVVSGLLICMCVWIYLSSSLEAKLTRAAQGSKRSAADEVLFVTDTTTVRLMSLGYRQAAADVIWLRTIQYFVQHLLTDRRYPWLEHFVDQIIELDPRFRQVYLWAGSCILYGGEITPDRVHASNRVYEAALKSFPNDYEPAYRLGMNYYSELRVEDPEERARYQRIGLAYFERAAQAPDAPPVVLDLIRGIARKMSRDDILLYALSDELARTSDPDRRQLISARIERLRTRMLSERADAATSAQAGVHLDWLSDDSAQTRLTELYQARQAEVRTYLSPLEYEMTFGASALPLDWRELGGLTPRAVSSPRASHSTPQAATDSP